MLSREPINCDISSVPRVRTVVLRSPWAMARASACAAATGRTMDRPVTQSNNTIADNKTTANNKATPDPQRPRCMASCRPESADARTWP